MKINRDRLATLLKYARLDQQNEELTDEQFVEKLANYMEVNPDFLDYHGVSHPGRFSYHTVGYGVFSLLGERYRMGRVEIFDRQQDTGYAVSEGAYCMPHVAANQFEDFIESLETDLPINIEIGSHKWCEYECAKDLGFENVGEMRDPEKVKEYRKKKNDVHAQEQGYKDFDDLLKNSKFGNLLVK
jgi:predicted house-cleaning noncanonical NTP pyrophosphatase (MazG superfamily)